MTGEGTVNGAERWAVDVIERARKTGARAEIQVTDSRREELVAADGAIVSIGESAETTATLRLARDGHVSIVTVPVTTDPRLLCSEALDLLARLPPWPPMAPLPARESPVTGGREPAAALSALAPRLAARTGAGRDDELRCTQFRRHVYFASDHVRHGYDTCGARLTYRLSYTGAEGGRKTHIDRGDAGPDIAELAARIEDRVITPSWDQVRGLATSARGPLPGRVVLDGEVAARLLALLAKGFSAEAVAHGRSRFADAMGSVVAEPWVTIIDDPAAPGGPCYAAFDDEGSPVRHRTLVSGGKLSALLGSRSYPDAGEGGCAWQMGPATAPRAAASNMWLDTSSCPPLPEDGPMLRVVQSQGMHTCNDITGEFSMGAFGLVQDGAGLSGVTDLTVAGNVYDMLHDIEAAGDRPYWLDGGDGCYGSPSLLVRGLSVGR